MMVGQLSGFGLSYLNDESLIEILFKMSTQWLFSNITSIETSIAHLWRLVLVVFCKIENIIHSLSQHCIEYCVMIIGIDTNIDVIVVSLTTLEAHHSPRAKPEGCGELPMSLMRQQWPKMRYQFLLYHEETKLMMNKSQNCPWLQHDYMFTSWGHVTWWFLLGNTCSNPCDVTVRFVTLNSNCTLNQNRQQNSHYHSWETDQN